MLTSNRKRQLPTSSLNPLLYRYPAATHHLFLHYIVKKKLWSNSQVKQKKQNQKTQQKNKQTNKTQNKQKTNETKQTIKGKKPRNWEMQPCPSEPTSRHFVLAQLWLERRQDNVWRMRWTTEGQKGIEKKQDRDANIVQSFSLKYFIKKIKY